MISCVHHNGFEGDVQQFKHKQEPLSLLSMFVNRIDLDNYKYVLVEISCPSSCEELEEGVVFPLIIHSMKSKVQHYN